TDIHAQLVAPDSTLFGFTILVDNSAATLDSWPSIAKSDGGTSWTIAWHRFVSGSNFDIFAARIQWDGQILDFPTQITSSTATEAFPRVSPPQLDGRVLLIYSHDFITDHDIDYAVLNGTSVQSTGNLTFLDANPTFLQDQIEYSIDSDDRRFV